jgi:hypothetical protein
MVDIPMRGAVKHVVLLVLLAILIILVAIPVLRRMEPHHDIAPPTAGTTSSPAVVDSMRVHNEREGTPGQPVWREVNHWEGSSDMTTPPFEITGHTWRIVWQTQLNPNEQTGSFDIKAYDPAGTLRSAVAATTKSDSGTTMLPGPGTYTLTIRTSQKWTVSVEQRG